jgi:hypothetical protein
VTKVNSLKHKQEVIEKNENEEIDDNEENKETQARLLTERRASKKKNRLKTIFNI